MAEDQQGKRSSPVLTCALCALCMFAGDGAASVVLAQDGEGASERRGDGQTIYRRKGSGGREVFTNAEEAVPVEERASSRVDLSKTSLNPELGNAIHERVEEEHAALARARDAGASDCSALQSLASRDTLTRVWEDDPMLLIGGGLVLLLAVFSPWMLGKLGMPSFVRFLAPIGVLAAAVAFGMERSDRSMAELKAKLAPCLSPKLESLAGVPAMPEGMTPVDPEVGGTSVPRSGAMRNVQADLQTIEGMQEDRADRAFKAATE